ncbi:MAG: DUF1573 domain-containing protein, partial [Acidobacteriota bacterium]
MACWQPRRASGISTLVVPPGRGADIDSLGADPLGRNHDGRRASSRYCPGRVPPLKREFPRTSEQTRSARAHQARAVVLALVTLAGCGPEGGAPQQPPKLVFASNAQELGTVEQGEPLQHRFDFRNDGGSALLVDNVKTSCDCAAVVAQPSTVAPGAAGSVAVRCDTDQSHGRVQRSVTVYSNDPAQPVLTLTLGGEVTADAVADPPSLYVGHLRRGERSE